MNRSIESTVRVQNQARRKRHGVVVCPSLVHYRYVDPESQMLNTSEVFCFFRTSIPQEHIPSLRRASTYDMFAFCGSN
jgi:hypothetical protein